MSLTALPFPAGSRSRGFSRRTLLAASAAGLTLLTTGCSSPADEREQVTTEQADELAAQVAVQESLVAAIAAAGAADPALASAVTDLASQAEEQLQRLKAAAPGKSAASSSEATPPAGAAARAWLRDQVATAATSHATACLDQAGARATLLGSIAAGLRGHDGRLA